jgi:hypothetical protein
LALIACDLQGALPIVHKLCGRDGKNAIIPLDEYDFESNNDFKGPKIPVDEFVIKNEISAEHDLLNRLYYIVES